MLDLFRMEVETQSAILTDSLLKWEQDQDATRPLEDLMRAAHSLKGAARIVGRKAAVRIAHAMEDCFVLAQRQQCTPSEPLTNTLLAGIDLIGRIGQVADEAVQNWEKEQETEIGEFRRASLLSQRRSVKTAADRRGRRPRNRPRDQRSVRSSHRRIKESRRTPRIGCCV